MDRILIDPEPAEPGGKGRGRLDPQVVSSFEGGLQLGQDFLLTVGLAVSAGPVEARFSTWKADPDKIIDARNRGF